MKKIILLIIAPFAFLSALSAQITQEEADRIILKRISQEAQSYTVYAKEDVQTGMTISAFDEELIELDYVCRVYYVRYIDIASGRYLIVKESDGNLLEINAKNDAGPSDLAEWRVVPERTICNVKNPLTDLSWLREYCKSLNETQNFSSVRIDLYKVIGKDEYVFKISIAYSEFDNSPCSYSIEWRNCISELIFCVFSCVTPMPGLVEEFMKDKEFVAELFHFVKQ